MWLLCNHQGPRLLLVQVLHHLSTSFYPSGHLMSHGALAIRSLSQASGRGYNVREKGCAFQVCQLSLRSFPRSLTHPLNLYLIEQYLLTLSYLPARKAGQCSPLPGGITALHKWRSATKARGDDRYCIGTKYFYVSLFL